MKHFYVYILSSASLDKYYIGATENVEERLRKHLANHSGFTGRAKDWVTVHTEVFDSKNAAMAREKQLKNWKSRNMIDALIKKS